MFLILVEIMISFILVIIIDYERSTVNFYTSFNSSYITVQNWLMEPPYFKELSRLNYSFLNLNYDY